MENQDVQLLKDYSDTEKGAYLGAIASIASADREASEQELQFLATLADSAHLSQESKGAVLGVAKDPKNLSVQKCLDVLKGSDLRYTFITDIMSFAKADGNLSGEEEQLIKGMADYLGVNQEQYGVLKQFVEVADESAKKGEVVQPQALSSGQSADPEGGFDSMLKKVGIPSNGLMKGILAIAAPLLISKVLMGNRRGGMGGMGSGGGMGGLLGGGLLGGLLGSVLGGGMSRGGMGGLGGLMGGGSTMGGGGLGSVLGGLGGLMGGARGGGGILGGGMGSILGSVLGGRRAGW